MFDLLTVSHRTAVSPAHYAGPDRRRSASAQRQPFLAMFDEIDYGMLLLTCPAHILHLNHAARIELDDKHPLQLLGGELRARRPKDVAPLYDALNSAAKRGLRKLLSVGDGAHRISVSVVPLPGSDQGTGGLTLMMLGKRQICGQLSIQGYARCHGLTAAEARVLEALAGGERPTEIAARLGVGIATVRTQIGNIRLKTGTSSIRALVWQVAGLPPMMNVLRSSSGADKFGEGRWLDD